METNEITIGSEYATAIIYNKKLNEKYKVIIDLEIVSEFVKHHWSSHIIRGVPYITTHIDNKHISLSRFIYGKELQKGMELAYRNRDRLDNRKNNIIEVDRATSAQNMRTPKNNKTGIKGVCWDNLRKQWRVYITANSQRFHLGCFSKIEDAVTARRVAELKYFRNIE